MKVKIKICVGTTCHLMGSSSLVDIKKKFPLEITDDIEVGFATCFGFCNGEKIPPIVEINGKFYEDMNEEKLIQIVKDLKEV
ncbi:NAD(P)H-dependent oxidoreductase subunit E [Haliovirga abyssi]|uniref:(2Fe-2S) ferredoxin domain-containing protein n=1 Tax=Haliovirga abyssi TaxID=2996794 RepID=A0AAU9DJJ9_9FUSO|nr:NAD(P)H-dependent oxidoreductase subunit E [Haliovirga abyssi]BDU51029.1 hypothetical protein HLVA_15980 [Haliovirga abyssi]